jgi:hypothetical protein
MFELATAGSLRRAVMSTGVARSSTDNTSKSGIRLVKFSSYHWDTSWHVFIPTGFGEVLKVTMNNGIQKNQISTTRDVRSSALMDFSSGLWLRCSGNNRPQARLRGSSSGAKAVIMALLGGTTVTDAAKHAGIHGTTIDVWLKSDAHFQAELNRAKGQV